MIIDIRTDERGIVHAKLLGDMDIYAKDMEDLKVAGREAFQCFVIACDLYGEGLEKELLKSLE